jgi:hypothetical protein
MLISLFPRALAALCTRTFNVSETPQIYAGRVGAGDVVCVNSTLPYLAVVLNRWESCVVHTHRYARDAATSDGPYTAASAYAGFDFGSAPAAAVDIAARAGTELSFGAVAFHARAHVRVISNHPADRLELSARAADALLVAHNQRVQYFNAAPGARRYDVAMAAARGDSVTFAHSAAESASFTGRQAFTRSAPGGAPEVVTWQSDSEDLSEFLEIDALSPEFATDRYVRLVTNGNRYTPIAWFELAVFPLWIVGVVAGAFAALLAVVGVLVVIVRRRGRRAASDDTAADAP